jgi:hypothetical protein
MGKSQKWACDKIIRKLNKISDLELEQRLAELWEILLQRKGQFPRSQELVPVKTSEPLLSNKRSKR